MKQQHSQISFKINFALEWRICPNKIWEARGSLLGWFSLFSSAFVGRYKNNFPFHTSSLSGNHFLTTTVDVYKMWCWWYNKDPTKLLIDDSNVGSTKCKIWVYRPQGIFFCNLYFFYILSVDDFQLLKTWIKNNNSELILNYTTIFSILNH